MSLFLIRRERAFAALISMGVPEGGGHGSAAGTYSSIADPGFVHPLNTSCAFSTVDVKHLGEETNVKKLDMKL